MGGVGVMRRTSMRQMRRPDVVEGEAFGEVALNEDDCDLPGSL